MASTEARELELIGKVELRIALADSDAKLESLLNTYLPPLLLKLASEHASVRQKVCSFSQALLLLWRLSLLLQRHREAITSHVLCRR